MPSSFFRSAGSMMIGGRKSSRAEPAAAVGGFKKKSSLSGSDVQGATVTKALYDYGPDNDGFSDGDLVFDKDDVIMVTESSGAWWKGFNMRDRAVVGNFPSNYVADTIKSAGHHMLTPLREVPERAPPAAETEQLDGHTIGELKELYDAERKAHGEEVGHLQESLAQLKEENQGLQATLEELKSRLQPTATPEQISAYTAEIASLKDELAAAQKAAMDAKQAEGKIHYEFSKLSDELAKLKAPGGPLARMAAAAAPAKPKAAAPPPPPPPPPPPSHAGAPPAPHGAGPPPPPPPPPPGSAAGSNQRSTPSRALPGLTSTGTATWAFPVTDTAAGSTLPPRRRHAWRR
jgi:regulator of replication initiation timing